jgi:predicted component of type VI protein secretion system
MDERLRRLAETIWDYHQLNHVLAPADAILVLCSHDTAVAERGAQLLLDGWAPSSSSPAASLDYQAVVERA